MGDLTKLIALVEGLKGPDREVDFRLHIALVEDAIWPARDMKGRIVNPDSRMSDYLAIYADVIRDDDQDFDFPRYTTSLDAAVALTERVLPGWGLSLKIAKRPSAGIWEPDALGPRFHGYHEVPAIALILATLKALQARELCNVED